MEENKFDMKNYLLEYIDVGSIGNKEILKTSYDNNYVYASYTIYTPTNGESEYNLIMPRFVLKTKETFEVLGLLQAEMGKTYNGCITFANSEPNIINKVLKWFEKEFNISLNDWKWYIAVNIQTPKDENYKLEIERQVINYWLENSYVRREMSHPKIVTYRNVNHTKLSYSDYGCVMIEHKRNLFSQIFKNFLKSVTYNEIANETNENIRNYMKGIIAGESTIACNEKSKSYSVHISATIQEEREVYKKALAKLNIRAKIYYNYKEILISHKINLIQLLKQGLMTVHKRKYAKFLNMIKKISQYC